MMYAVKTAKYAFALALVALVGCASAPPYDYSAFNAHKPRSILVLPPANNSIEVEASYTYLSTISRPLAEKGYYVFPVSVIDTLFRENGIPSPEEMHLVPLDKISEIIGADAVLYVTIEDWGQKYQVLSSKTVVSADLRLVDVATGTHLWNARAHMEQSSDSGNNGLIGALVGAVVDQIAGSVADRTPGVARLANTVAINSENRGLLDGPYLIQARGTQ